MKKLFLVFGRDSSREIELATNIKPIRFGYKGFVVYCINDEEEAAKKRVLTAIQYFGESDYDNMLIAYAGSNLRLLNGGLPCPSLNIAGLREKLAELVAGNFPKQKELVTKMFVGCIGGLMGQRPLSGNFEKEFTYINHHVI